MLSKTEFFANEKRLFESLGYGRFMVGNLMQPLALYNTAANDAFAFGKRGENIEALRRGYHALNYGKVYRMTPEFEKLTEFS